MKGIELMTVSPPCTAVLTMEMSLPLISKKSEQDPAASSVGSQSLHFPMSRKYVDSPAIPKLTLVLPAACSHTSSWLGSPHLYVIIREEGMQNIQRRKLFSLLTREYSSRLDHYGNLDYNFTKRHISVTLCLLWSKLGNTYVLSLVSKEKSKIIHLAACFSHCFLFEEIG